jgi:hypothetical protein
MPVERREQVIAVGIGSTGNDEPDVRRKAAAFVRWHEPLAGINIVGVLIAGSVVVFATWVTTLWIQRHPLLLEVARVRSGIAS